MCVCACVRVRDTTLRALTLRIFWNQRATCLRPPPLLLLLPSCCFFKIVVQLAIAAYFEQSCLDNVCSSLSSAQLAATPTRILLLFATVQQLQLKQFSALTACSLNVHVCALFNSQLPIQGQLHAGFMQNMQQNCCCRLNSALTLLMHWLQLSLLCASLLLQRHLRMHKCSSNC